MLAHVCSRDLSGVLTQLRREHINVDEVCFFEVRRDFVLIDRMREFHKKTNKFLKVT